MRGRIIGLSLVEELIEGGITSLVMVFSDSSLLFLLRWSRSQLR